MIRKFKFEENLQIVELSADGGPKKARCARSQVKPRTMEATRPWRAVDDLSRAECIRG